MSTIRIRSRSTCVRWLRDNLFLLQLRKRRRRPLAVLLPPRLHPPFRLPQPRVARIR
jgi:hypothetical protein